VTGVPRRAEGVGLSDPRSLASQPTMPCRRIHPGVRIAATHGRRIGHFRARCSRSPADTCFQWKLRIWLRYHWSSYSVTILSTPAFECCSSDESRNFGDVWEPDVVVIGCCCYPITFVEVQHHRSRLAREPLGSRQRFPSCHQQERGRWVDEAGRAGVRHIRHTRQRPRRAADAGRRVRGGSR